MREQFARVTRVFVHYARGDGLTTFEAGGRIEVCALTTGVEVSVAVWTRAIEADV